MCTCSCVVTLNLCVHYIIFIINLSLSLSQPGTRRPPHHLKGSMLNTLFQHDYYNSSYPVQCQVFLSIVLDSQICIDNTYRENTACMLSCCCHQETGEQFPPLCKLLIKLQSLSLLYQTENTFPCQKNVSKMDPSVVRPLSRKAEI